MTSFWTPKYGPPLMGHFDQPSIQNQQTTTTTYCIPPVTREAAATPSLTRSFYPHPCNPFQEERLPNKPHRRRVTPQGLQYKQT